MKKEELLFQELVKKPLPRHIAIIMDGNGRWAKKRGLPRIVGHQKGAESVREAVQSCGELGIQVLTLYTFSTENWSRPKNEINGLMNLLCAMLKKETENLNKNNVFLRVSGKINELPEKVNNELQISIDKLKNNTGLILNLALNYGARQEILDAVNKILALGIKSVDETSFKNYLYTASLPDPDLLIRTSGEYRISNFLLYQIAYAELYITPVLWPDFRKLELYCAIQDYQKRERRFGRS
ncbi:MAG: isoprenyl transferase [Elusimicrobia bacterium]|nr:isoprenyl transferase [Elusimicrobiota bacterium]